MIYSQEKLFLKLIDHTSSNIYGRVFHTMEAALKDGHRMTVKGMAQVLGITPAQWREILWKHYGPRMILTRGRRGGIQIEGITFQVLGNGIYQLY